MEEEEEKKEESAHLKLPEVLLGRGVRNVTEMRPTDGLLCSLQPGLQVAVVLHVVVPQEPLPLQPGQSKIRQVFLEVKKEN